ncbi:MAG: hypothetical protein DRH76_11275, partial [Deltaproteobacteria bacterium]
MTGLPNPSFFSRPELLQAPKAPLRPPSIGLNTLARGTDLMQQNLYQGGEAGVRAFEETAGIELPSVRGYLQEGADRNAEEAALNPAVYGSSEDIKGVGDILPFAAEKALESAPQVIPYAAGALLGPLGLRAGATAAARKIAQTTGATFAGTVGHTGELEKEALETADRTGEKPMAAWKAIAGGVARAGIDVIGMERLLGASFGAAKATSIMGVAKEVLKGAGAGAVAEAPTEALQEAIAIGLRAHDDPEFDPYGKESQTRIKEAFIGGLAAGSFSSGLGRGAASVLKIPGEVVTKPTPDNITGANPIEALKDRMGDFDLNDVKDRVSGAIDTLDPKVRHGIGAVATALGEFAQRPDVAEKLGKLSEGVAKTKKFTVDELKDKLGGEKLDFGAIKEHATAALGTLDPAKRYTMGMFKKHVLEGLPNTGEYNLGDAKAKIDEVAKGVSSKVKFTVEELGTKFEELSGRAEMTDSLGAIASTGKRAVATAKKHMDSIAKEVSDRVPPMDIKAARVRVADASKDIQEAVSPEKVAAAKDSIKATVAGLYEASSLVADIEDAASPILATADKAKAKIGEAFESMKDSVPEVKLEDAKAKIESVQAKLKAADTTAKVGKALDEAKETVSNLYRDATLPKVDSAPVLKALKDLDSKVKHSVKDVAKAAGAKAPEVRKALETLAEDGRYSVRELYDAAAAKATREELAKNYTKLV